MLYYHILNAFYFINTGRFYSWFCYFFFDKAEIGHKVTLLIL